MVSQLPGPALDAALDFLKNLRGLHHLVAIDPDSGAIEGKTFSGAKPDEIREWIESRNLTKNVYWSTGVVRRDFKGAKPKDVDIVTARMLKVDLDPLPVPTDWGGTPEEWIEKERELIFPSLTDDLPDGVPGRPTIVLDSGSGLWGLWIFALPYEGLEPDEAEYIRACGEHLIELYRARLGKDRADGVADLSRIARLPGTVNHPGEKKKLKKGRSVTLASVVEDAGDPSRTYGPASFLKPEEVVKPKARKPRAKAPKPSGVTQIDSLDELPEAILGGRARMDSCKVVIAQGCDPDNPWRFGGPETTYGLARGDQWTGDRSAAVWSVCCELVRSGVDDDTIRALLLDDGWGISDHVLDQSNPEACADRQIDRAREEVGDDVGRPVIFADPGRLAEVVTEASRSLIYGNVPIYQRGPELVRPVVLDKSTAEDGVRRARGATVIRTVAASWLTTRMAESADWRKHGKKNDYPTDPLEKHARAILGEVGNWPFPVLRGIVTAPTLRADGSVLQVPGFDSASGLIFEPGGAEFPTVPDRPTRADAVAALAKFEPLLGGFPFVDEAARSVVFSAILSGLVCQVLPAVPLHAFDAPTAGTGKSLLAETVGVIVLGHKPSAMNQGKEEAEDEKRLSTALRAGDPVIWIDNAERVITGDTICSILTQEFVLMRILGRSEQVSLPCNVLVMATGNNLTIGGDVTRRSVVCRLDSKDERPDQREFEFNPKLVALDRRAELVVAGLTALRAYIVANRPGPLTPVGSFEDWSRWVRETIVWCGYGDPDATRTAVLADDPKKAELVEVLEVWFHAWGDNELTVREASEAEDLKALLIEATGRPIWSSKSVGRFLKRHVDRVVSGLVIREVGSRGGVKRWRVEALDGRPREYGAEDDRDLYG